MFFKSLIILSIDLILIQMSLQLSCLDERGSPVDWFIVYKIPKLETSSIDTLNSGYGYVYITDKTIKNKANWTLSERQVDEKTSLFGHTIGSVITDRTKSDLSYVVYNDEAPDSTSSGTLAHSKGLFAYDSRGGIWLTHSVPKFPSIKRSYTYPKTATKNGQTALCITIDKKDTISLNSIATNLLVMRPHIYDIKIEDNLSDKSGQFLDLKDKEWIKSEPSIQSQILSKNGEVFTTFSKSKEFDDDIYSGLIGPHYKQDFLVQSWRNGAGGKLSSKCRVKYQVQNIDRITIPIVKSVEWEYTEDHSKWAITSDTKGKSYTCIADINRVKSQYKRGGGSLCMDSKLVWKIFKTSVEEIEGCSKTSG